MVDVERLYSTLAESFERTLDRLGHERDRRAGVVDHRREQLDARKTRPARERAVERLQEAELPLAFIEGQIEIVRAALAENEALGTAPPAEVEETSVSEELVSEEPDFTEETLEKANALWAWLETQDDSTHDITLYMPGEHEAVGDAEFILVAEGPAATTGRGPFAHAADEIAMGYMLAPYGLRSRPVGDDVIGFYPSS